MGNHRWAAIGLMLICVAACGGTEDGGDAGPSGTSPLGVWELRYQDAVGQPYLNVLELRDDGTYTTHMQDATPGDTGQFTFTDTAITLTSAVNPQFSRPIPYELDGELLKLMIGGTEAAPIFADWSRSSLSRTMLNELVAGQRVPSRLDINLMQLFGVAQNWNEDAVPTWIRAEADQNGEFDVVLHFFSPSTEQEMRVQLSPYDAKYSVHDGSRTVKAPLPAEFLDLPAALTAASEAGSPAALVNANLRVFENYGPVWRLVQAGGRQTTLSAESGELITEDVTGFADQYNADWAYAGELWRQVMEQYQSDDESEGCPDTSNEFVCLDNSDCTWIEPQAALSDGSCVRGAWAW